jgi:hypothetical protein
LPGSHDTSCISGRRNTVIGDLRDGVAIGLAAAAMVAGRRCRRRRLVVDRDRLPENLEALSAIARIEMSVRAPAGHGHDQR